MLIDEIEGLAREPKIGCRSEDDPRWCVGLLVQMPYWPRIRAALLAAMEMDDELMQCYERDGYSDPSKCQRQFRKEMG